MRGTCRQRKEIKITLKGLRVMRESWFLLFFAQLKMWGGRGMYHPT